MYEQEYKAFVDRLATGEPISGEEVGKLIVRFAQYFGEAIKSLTSAEFGYRKKIVEYEKSSDENGKPFSSAKAESFAQATPEYQAYIIAKGDVATIEQQINALKALQKGVSNDFAYQGGN